MKSWKKYFDGMESVIKKVSESQEENIMAAADILTNCTKDDGIIHVFGVGHSNLISEEVFRRSATLANVHAIFESSVAGINEIAKTNKLERQEGTGQIIVEYQKLSPPDALICISNSGNNAVTIDVAMAAKDRGLKVIAITNVEYADQLQTLHSSGNKLKDIADVVIDNCSIIGDAVVEVEGLDMRVGPASSIPNILIINSILVQTVENLVEMGIEPDVYYNDHLGFGSDKDVNLNVSQHNKKLHDKYFWRIRNL